MENRSLEIGFCIFMTVMDVGHVVVLVLGVGMLMLVCVGNVCRIMLMELVMPVAVLMHHRHMDVEVGMLFICQQ